MLECGKFNAIEYLLLSSLSGNWTVILLSHRIAKNALCWEVKVNYVLSAECTCKNAEQLLMLRNCLSGNWEWSVWKMRSKIKCTAHSYSFKKWHEYKFVLRGEGVNVTTPITKPRYPQKKIPWPHSLFISMLIRQPKVTMLTMYYQSQDSFYRSRRQTGLCSFDLCCTYLSFVWMLYHINIRQVKSIFCLAEYIYCMKCIMCKVLWVYD